MKYKKNIKGIIYFLILIFAGIQFFRPARNISSTSGNYSNDIQLKYNVPDSIQSLLKTSCYDCHSNNTNYPWYAAVQPIAWWLNNHIQEGKKEINFSEFTAYPIRRQYKKLKDIVDQVKEGDMPLSSYTLIHRNAILKEKQQVYIINWANHLRDSFKLVYPPDSFTKK